MKCANCGVPEGALTDKGQSIQITRRAENAFQRDRKVAVWVCTRECGLQQLAISRYGDATHKWPVTLAQFRAANKGKV
jgi:hypothetical protein